MDYNKLYEDLPKQPVKWTVADIQIWLRFIGLSNLYGKFKQLAIDGSCITSLTEEDLKTQLSIQSGIIIKKIMSWVNKGLKQYTQFVDAKSINSFSDLREVTQKSKTSQPIIPLATDIKQTFKHATNKNISIPVLSPIQSVSLKKVKSQAMQEEQSVLIEEQQQKKKQFQLIIQQNDGPQTSFFSVKEDGAKIGRHSSNQILILDQNISRYHAQIKFQNGIFYLKDIGSTTGTFIKIQQRKPIYDKMILEMGSNQFQASLSNNNTLSLTIVEGPGHDMMMQIPKTSGKVTIGRKPNNLINFPDDQHLSNTHSTILYLDGRYYIEDNNTTNGTWQRLSLENQLSNIFELKDKTIFKIGTNQTYICKIKISYVSTKTHPNACVICCDQDKDCVYMPCKHNTACIKCSKNLKQCPICRVKIQDWVRIYKN